MKKLTATLLAVLLVLSLSITAFAANDKTITVNGAENGKIYGLYKIFDVKTVNDETAYSIPSGKEEVYKSSTLVDAEGNTVAFTSLFDINTGADGATYVARKTATTNYKVITWAKSNLSMFGEAVQTVTAANGTAVFTSLADGYYYVKSPVSSGATAMIADTSQTATVNEKNSTPGWGDNGGKTANGDTYYAGEEITYTLTYENAVNYDKGEQVTKYIIKDSLPEGITFKEIKDVTVNGNSVKAELTDEGTVTNGFFKAILWTNADNTSKYTNNPSVIVVTYTATMGNTKIATGIVNTASIYPDTNKHPGEETQKKDTVYTGKLELNKQDGTSKTPLPGAKFIVKVLVEKTEAGQPNVYHYLKETEKTVGTETVKTYTEVETEAEATKFVTGDDGKITLAGLKAGTYVFTEIEAPVGYMLPENCDVASAMLSLAAEGKMDDSRTVYNGKAAAMPETGGMGTTLFYVIGGLLAVGAVVMLITQKRMRAVQ